VLPLSHDEVVHGKRSLLHKLPGDEWRKFANLRLLFATMFAQPGKKLLFMGNEIAQRREWSHESGLDWELLELPLHAGVSRWVRDLNRLYRSEPALHERDCAPDGFRWVDCNDADASVVSLLRTAPASRTTVLVVCNYTPIVRREYVIGAPFAGFWREALNGDATPYGGSGVGNADGVEAEPIPAHGLPCSLRLTLPPLAALFLIGERDDVPPADPPLPGTSVPSVP
jgi:1,4-alpha-glucan branching enzyme